MDGSDLFFMNVTEDFLQYLQIKSELPLPERVIAQAKKCLLDYVGVTNAGAFEAEQQMHSYLAHAAGNGGASVIGASRSADVLSAAFANGFHAHVMELDDGHRFGMIHLAAPIISAVLAAAQTENASGDAVLKGIVMGYEAAVRLAISIQPEHKKRGFHTAGTCGTIGAAVGAGFVLGLNSHQMKAAVSAAGASAAGLLEIQENSSELKPYNTGHAAMSGVNAAYIGLSGFAGPDDILGGQRGMANILAAGADKEKLTASQDYYEIERIYLKPYAACRHCHSAIEAAMTLRKETSLLPEEIKKIQVNTYKLAVKGHDHTQILGTASAKLSIPYSVAAAYLLCDCGPDTFSQEKTEDEKILALTGKVKVVESKEFSDLSPAKRIAEVQITDFDGKCYQCRVDYAKGDPENPMSVYEVEDKFRMLMGLSGKADMAEKIQQAVYHIETESTILYSLL